MKKLRMVVVGKLKENFFVDACNEYIKRLSRFVEVELCEIKDRSNNKAAECDDILSSLKGKIILSDIEGESMPSERFSAFLTDCFLYADTVSFVIGGSVGVDERVKAKADKRVSFGKMTYPHMLMRVIALEQIYRAFTIKEGMPYHK